MNAISETGVIGLSPSNDGVLDALRDNENSAILRTLDAESLAETFAASFETTICELTGSDLKVQPAAISICEDHAAALLPDSGRERFAYLSSADRLGMGFMIPGGDLQRFVHAILTIQAQQPTAENPVSASPAERALFTQLLHQCIENWNRQNAVFEERFFVAKPRELAGLSLTEHKALAGGKTVRSVEIDLKFNFQGFGFDLQMYLPMEDLDGKRFSSSDQPQLTRKLKWQSELEYLAGDVPVEIRAVARIPDFPVVRLAEAKPGDLLKIFPATQHFVVECDDGTTACNSLLILYKDQLKLRAIPG